MEYANLVKRIRLKLYLTQTEFAKLLGVSFETINRWENNKNQPTMKYKRKLNELIADRNIEVTK